jgi:hypothetical protein
MSVARGGGGGMVEVCFDAACGNTGCSSAEVHDHGSPLSPPYLRRHLKAHCLAARTVGANGAHSRLRNFREVPLGQNVNCCLFMTCLTTFFSN